MKSPSECQERDIIRRDRNGVVLRYVDPSVRRAHHAEKNCHGSDRERMAVIKAERELLIIWLIFEHLDVSDIGMTRILDAIYAIQQALNLKRPALGMEKK